MIVTIGSESSEKVTPAPLVRITVSGIIFNMIPLCFLLQACGCGHCQEHWQ